MRLIPISRATFAHRQMIWTSAIVGVVITLPTLWTGWIGDDHFHRFVMTKPEASRALGVHNTDTPGGLFTFFDGDPTHVQAAKDSGIAPWWTYEKLKSSFFRPISWLTHRLDYCFWPRAPWLMHAQSLIWYALTIIAVGYLYRDLHGSAWVAGLGMLLYAIDDAHIVPVGWIANRNAMISTFFGLLCLIAHHQWRRKDWRIGALLGPSLLGLSLLAGESGIATFAYLFAYALFLDTKTVANRMTSLVSYVIVIAVWRIAWQAMGYGADGGGIFYIDPGTAPVRFLATMVERGPRLLLAQWAFPSADIDVFLPVQFGRAMWFVAVTFLASLCTALIPLIRRDRLARFWAMGLILSLVPPCASLPSDRNLLFLGVGSMGLLAQFIALMAGGSKGWNDVPSGSRRKLVSQVMCIFLVAVHALIAPVTLFARSFMPLGPSHIIQQLHIGDAVPHTFAPDTVVIVNTPSVLHAGYLPLLRAMSGEPVPNHTRVLGPSLTSVTLRRPNSHTLIVRPEGGFLTAPIDQVFRSNDVPMPVGLTINLTGMTVEVTELTDDARPTAAIFRFDVNLEDESLFWLKWESGRYVRFAVPDVGEVITLPAPIPSLFRSHRNDR